MLSRLKPSEPCIIPEEDPNRRVTIHDGDGLLDMLGEGKGDEYDEGEGEGDSGLNSRLC